MKGVCARMASMMGVWTVLLLTSIPGVSRADLSVLLADDFDDGDYAGWTVGYLFDPGKSVDAPAVVPSPGGYAVRGVDSGYVGSGLAALMYRPLAVDIGAELTIEMRAKSGPQLPNHAMLHLVLGDDKYEVIVWGEGNRRVDFLAHIGGGEDRFSYDIGSEAYEWLDYAWRRDGDGWWSLSIDGTEVWTDFAREETLVSFDHVQLGLMRDQTEIEWVRICAEAVTPGDANRDGAVDDHDLSLLLVGWEFGPPEWGFGNFNGDDIVGDDDLSLLLANWMKNAIVPEPTALSVLIFGAAVLWRGQGSRMEG